MAAGRAIYGQWPIYLKIKGIFMQVYGNWPNARIKRRTKRTDIVEHK